MQDAPSHQGSETPLLDSEPSPPVPEGVTPETTDALERSIEAVLLTADRPVPGSRLAEILGLASSEPSSTEPERPRRGKKAAGPGAVVEAAVDRLNDAYARTGRSFRIQAVAGGYRILTLPDFAPVLSRFHLTRASSKLSRAAIESLAIIAYKQPITRVQLEAIRGVACGEVLRSLMERRLVAIVGRSEELGRPILYGTTREFLDAFGLASLRDLPTASELSPAP